MVLHFHVLFCSYNFLYNPRIVCNDDFDFMTYYTVYTNIMFVTILSACIVCVCVCDVIYDIKLYDMISRRSYMHCDSVQKREPAANNISKYRIKSEIVFGEF